MNVFDRSIPMKYILPPYSQLSFMWLNLEKAYSERQSLYDADQCIYTQSIRLFLARYTKNGYR